uniref:Putative secreted protein n=1 Tax=Amblyomma triste TaxID=251400 RepID=A0A023GA68_AMBTT
MKLAVLGVVLCAITVATVFSEELALKPGCTRDQLNACGSDFLVYSNVTKLPEGGKEFDDYCKYLAEQISCSEEFVQRCLDGIPRVAVVIGLQAMDELYEATCTEGNEQNEIYHKSIACLNKVGTDLNRCHKTMRDDMEKGIVVAPKDKTSGYACCAFHTVEDCFDEALEGCSDTPAKQFMHEIMEKVFGEPLSLVCGQYMRGSDACKELPKLPFPTDDKNFGKSTLMELAIDHAGSFFNKH